MKISARDVLAARTASAPSAARSRLGWTDFQIVLAVAQDASVARAATTLAMSHVTLLRKLDAIETRLHAKLFERVRGRYTPTTAGEALIGAAKSMEPLATDAEMRVLGQDMRPSGDVRVTAASIVIDQLLPPVLGQFAAAFPDVVIELTSSREHVSLIRREADVALRVSDQVPDWLVARKLGAVDFCIYGLRRQGLTQALREPVELFGQRRWISFERDARELKFDRWLDAHVPDASVVGRVDGFGHALSMVRAGLGVALLPTFVELSCPELLALTAPIAALRTPMWLLTHQELRQAMRIKVLIRAFAPALSHALQ